MGTLRFGLVGTGHWARIAHAPALASAEGIEFTSVWGRSPEAVGELAGAFDVAGYQDFDEFLASVDAVAFSVPPDVQEVLAVLAAEAGKHLLLEKPIALTKAGADRLVDVVAEAGVASVVFFTSQFQPDVREWMADAASRGHWTGGAGTWLGTAMRADSPFNTTWRQVKGGLWDVAPHLVALLIKSLGPVESVTARAGLADVTHLVLGHQGGATSTVTATLSASEDAEYVDLYLWGATGRSVAPTEFENPVPPLRTALGELAANAAAGRTEHPLDVRFGRDVVYVLADAETQLPAT